MVSTAWAQEDDALLPFFRERSAEHLAEIRHVLRPQGRFCIAFGDESFMRDLPFTPFDFNFYNAEKVRSLLQDCGFRVLDFQQHLETDRSNSGEVLDKVINIILCDGQCD